MVGGEEGEGRVLELLPTGLPRAVYTYIHVHGKVTALVCCVALPCCLFDLACFFLPSFSHLSLKHVLSTVKCQGNFLRVMCEGSMVSEVR